MRKSVLVWICVVFLMAALVLGYLKWLSFVEAPYECTRKGSTYTNPYYGFQITEKDGWLRSVNGSSLGSRFVLGRLFDNPAPLLSSKRELLVFHKIGKKQHPEAVVNIAPVDHLKGKYYGRSLEIYARASLESIMATKMRVNEGQIKVMDINGRPCAKVRVSLKVPDMGDMEAEYYFFINDGKGFAVGYMAIPSKFEQNRDEAMAIIQSFRFLDKSQARN